jgi:hypothetical protein
MKTTTLDRRRGNEAAEHGAEIPVSPNRFRDWPASIFRPHEGPATGYLFANGRQRQTIRPRGLELRPQLTATRIARIVAVQ